MILKCPFCAIPYEYNEGNLTDVMEGARFFKDKCVDCGRAYLVERQQVEHTAWRTAKPEDVGLQEEAS